MTIGELNFELENIIEVHFSKCSWSKILKTFSNELIKYKKAQEEYMDGSHPTIYINNRVYTPVFINNSNKAFTKLIKSYIINHELQMGEVLYLVYGYLNIHRPDLTPCNFKYKE